MKILLTGGRGELGRAITPLLLKAGYTVRISSRSPQPQRKLDYEWAQMQIATGEGIEAAVEEVDVILHAASSPTQTQAVDVEGTRRLLEAAQKAGVSHFVYISIVGIDRIPFAYYKAKLAAENLIQASPMPWSILRATQFHTFIDLLLGSMNKLPFGLLPLDFKSQPIAVEETAERLFEVIQAGAGGRLPDIGGPEVLTLRQMAKDWLAVRGMWRPLVNLPVVGKVGMGFRRGYNTVPENPYGQITWHDWLAKRYTSAHVLTA